MHDHLGSYNLLITSLFSTTSQIPEQKAGVRSSVHGPLHLSPARELPEALAPGLVPRACG